MDQFKAAMLILAARHLIPRNTLSFTFSALGCINYYIPADKRRPIPQLISYLQSQHPPPHTHSQFIRIYNCTTGLLEFTSQEDDALIGKLLTGKIQWTQESNSYLIHPFSHSTLVQENINSKNLTHKSQSQKTSLDHLRLRMERLLAKASKIS